VLKIGFFLLEVLRLFPDTCGTSDPKGALLCSHPEALSFGQIAQV